VTNYRRNYESQVDTGDEMKSFIRRRFVPSHYYRELYQRLQSLSQGIESVDDYFKEMKLVVIRANIEEDMEATMARFMNCLDHDIAHIVELHHYMELKEIMHMAVKVEKQLKRKGTIWPSQPLGPSKPWKPNWKANIGGGPSPQNEEGKVEYPKKKKNTSTVVKGNNFTPTSCNYDIKCFYYLGFGHVASHCPNKIVMVMKANNEDETDGEDEEEKMLPLDDDDIYVEYPVEG
jgi:hypothetical protein